MPKIPYNKRPDGRYYKQIIIGRDENGKRKVKTLFVPPHSGGMED